MRKRLKIDSELVHLGRDLDKSSGYVNIPPYEGSTILHHDIADMKNRVRLQMNGEASFTYGTEGGPAHQAFYEAMNQLEGGAGTWAYGTGLAAALLRFLHSYRPVTTSLLPIRSTDRLEIFAKRFSSVLGSKWNFMTR